jgi:hypothetical protein
MSHTNVIYPQSTDRKPVSWQVREDDDDGEIPSYSMDDPVQETPLELAARVSAQLNRAVVLAGLLKNAECPPRRTINDTLFVITGLIEEAVEDNENLRAKLLDQGPPKYG